ncbi:MAG TPA: PP2C family protein-serine/threonine phosphatase [Acidobacteriaceae bacterium]|jgi:serine phosphatase RsbU (regulator of sigma subunit)|nr:PP2C family protein-serine/threonine phosphatase [Acidobacteriaceae bacterium]
MKRLETFWQRVTDGMEISQLWKQFQADARSSYRLYSREVDTTQEPGTKRTHHFFDVAKQFFWAIVEKLTPARRVLLLIALVLLFTNIDWVWSSGNGRTDAVWFGGAFWAGLLLLALLVLEVADRVVMKRDLQIAKEIQAWLLPANPPQVPGLEIAFATRPANTVAGDYYDVFSRQGESGADSTFLIAVADVAGKSVPAAMLMATFQASLKTLARTPGSLADLVGRMNSYACSNSQNGRRFTTTFLAEYDPGSRRLMYVNAGHNPPMLRRSSGAIERLEAGGMPVGILEGAPYEAGAVTLESGDWLVIFTDGVTEAENKFAQEYGEARLMAVVNALAAVGPPVMLNAIMHDLDRFVGEAPQHDDVTLLLVKAV